MILWIFLGLGIAFFGICIGIWKDQAQETEKKIKTKTKTKEALTSNVGSATTSKTHDTMFQYLSEKYSDNEKIRMLSQIPELMDGKNHHYNNYNFVLNDNKLSSSEKVESLKQKLALKHYIPSFIKTPNECINNYLIPLGFTDPKIKQILSEKKNKTDTLNTLQAYLKRNNF
jgi:hypothetical protein